MAVFVVMLAEAFWKLPKTNSLLFARRIAFAYTMFLTGILGISTIISVSYDGLILALTSCCRSKS